MLRRAKRSHGKSPQYISSLFSCGITSLGLVSCSHSSKRDPSSLTFLIESSPTNLDPRFATEYLPLWFNDVVSVHRRSLGNLDLPSTGNYNFLATLPAHP